VPRRRNTEKIPHPGGQSVLCLQMPSFPQVELCTYVPDALPAETLPLTQDHSLRSLQEQGRYWMSVITSCKTFPESGLCKSRKSAPVYIGVLYPFPRNSLARIDDDPTIPQAPSPAPSPTNNFPHTHSPHNSLSLADALLSIPYPNHQKPTH
jgi:hypothetical protein